MVEDGKKVVVFGPLDNNNRSNNTTIARNNWGPAGPLILWTAVILGSGASSTPLELILFPGETDAHPFGVTRDARGAACAQLALDRRKECLRASVDNCANE
jgi:hypothetical protein